ncbi:MAG: REX4, RNA exonuclease 4, partial [Paramarteilia canceri]
DRRSKGIAIDCEMVGSGTKGRNSMLARVSIVDEDDKILYDSFVRPTETITDYRTRYSGVKPSSMDRAKSFSRVQKKVATIIEGRILVGHDISNDLRILNLKHPSHLTRDTSQYEKFKNLNNGSKPSLKFLTSELLDREIQNGPHSSIEDAKATINLYSLVKEE